MIEFLKKIGKRIKENFMKNKVLLFAFIIIWLIVIIITCSAYNNTIGKHSVGNESYDRSVVEVDNKTTVEAIVPTENDAESVSILLATYARKNEGNVTISVNGENSKYEYAKEIFNVNDVIDNDYVTIKLNKNLDIKVDEKIRVTITSNSENGKAIGVYYSNTDEFENSSLLVNNEEIEAVDLSLKFLVNDETMNTFATSLIVSTIAIITIISLVLLLLDPKEEILFTLIVFLLGIVMMIVIVPGSPPDELSHYEVELQVSNLLMGEDIRTIDSIYTKYGYMYGHYNISAGYTRLLNDFGKTVKLTGKMSSLGRDYSEIYWAQYLPNVIGLTLGRLLKLNMITTFYLGRFTGLLFYTFCVYLAIRKAPSYKYILGIVASLPMFVQTSISLTYDVWILGLSFLSIGYFLNWFLLKKEIKLREFIFVFLFSLALAPAKVLYSFYAFLYIFVPYQNYGSKLKKWIASIIIIAPSIWQLYGIMYPAIYQFVHIVLKGDISHNLLSESSSEVITDVVEEVEVRTFSIRYMIKHPIETIEIFVRTIRYKIKYWFYGSIGRTLSGDTLVLPLKLVHILVIIPFVAIFVSQKYTLPIYMRIIFILMCIVIGLYAMIGMFVSWTTTGQEIIEDYGGIIVEGIQGRYFSPILPFFFSAISNNKIKLSEKINKYILLTYLMIFFVIIMYVLSYTFVN